MKYEMYGGMCWGTIDKRTYETNKFIKNLDPAMDEVERQQAIVKYMYRPDLDVIKAITDPNNGASNCEAFCKALCKAIETDTEPLEEKIPMIARAMARNDAQALLIALCGYGATSLGKIAMMIPDDGEEFYNTRVPATMIVGWSNGETSESKCYVDSVTNKVYGFKRSLLQELRNSTEVEWVGVKVKPLCGKEKYFRECISEEKRESTKDEVSFWYSVDPDDYNEPGPDVFVDSPY